MYDISSQHVTIYAPASGSLNGYTQEFYWSKVDGAISYDIIIKETSADTILLDTVIINTTNTFKYTFDPGNYEWRINARNGVSQTGFTSSSFTILIQPLNISTVQLSLPVNQGYSNDTVTDLSWKHLYLSTTYELQMNTENLFTGTLFKDTIITRDSLQGLIHLGTQGLYYWRVRGCSPTDTSLWSNVFSFTYDTIPPDSVTQTKPLNASTGNASSGSLEWDALGFDVTSYNVYITYGTAAQTIVQSSVDSYPYTGTSGVVVSWQVQAVDEAGNKGPMSPVWTFTIQ